MTIKKTSVLLPLIPLLLTGCATTEISRNFTMSQLQPNSGLAAVHIYCSFTTGTGSYIVTPLNRKHKDYASSSYNINFDCFQPGLLIKNDPDSNTVYAIQLPAGKYALSKFTVDEGDSTFIPNSNYKIYFNVKPSKISIIGQINLLDPHPKNKTLLESILSENDAYLFSFQKTNNSTVYMLKQKWPNLQKSTIIRYAGHP